MALGNGCPYKANGRCKQCARETDYFRSNYCNNDLNWSRCAYTPGNVGNKQAQQEMDNFKQGAGLGALVLVAIVVYALWKFF